MIFPFILNIVAKNVNEVVNMNLLCPIIAQSDPQDCKNQNGQLETGTWDVGGITGACSCNILMLKYKYS